MIPCRVKYTDVKGPATLAQAWLIGENVHAIEHNRGQTKHLNQLLVSSPLDFIVRQIFGALPKTRNGSQFNVIMTNRISKILQTLPCLKTWQRKSGPSSTKMGTYYTRCQFTYRHTMKDNWWVRFLNRYATLFVWRNSKPQHTTLRKWAAKTMRCEAGQNIAPLSRWRPVRLNIFLLAAHVRVQHAGQLFEPEDTSQIGIISTSLLSILWSLISRPPDANDTTFLPVLWSIFFISLVICLKRRTEI